MASDLDDIISIVLTRESTPVATASFNIPLILAEGVDFAERTRIYTSMTGVAEDFDVGDQVYTIASALFGQSTVGARPAAVVVGKVEADEEWVDAYDAVNTANDTWYLLIPATHDPVIVEALSDRIQADRKIMGTSTQGPAAITTATTDIGSILSLMSAGRTYGIYLPTADAQYPEAVWAGSQLAYTPGSNDWDFKRGVGATVSRLSATAQENLRSKNYNMYISKGGVNVFMDGNMFDGTPIDQVIGEDWLYARLQEGIYFRIINSLKIPMTNPGLAMVENEIRTVLSQAEANGLIDRGWTVTTPDVLDIPANMRAQRTAGVFVLRARLAGSIRKVQVQGYLSV